ncbi:MAG: dihydrofolate reductase [Planctomycetes bacterium]|nr:dihydrofolate reductase [Planctomycetota bacterium]MCA8944749.1 dihydrofolate reductase [Planctomycetota bacterium]
MATSKIRAFFAMSLDGFIAGPNDELDWLDVAEGAEDTFTPFIKQIGALLMGRRSYDVASSFDGPWPYGELPVLVTTHRELSPKVPSVSACTGTIQELVERAKAVATPKDVYIDGGQLIRQALQAGLVDEITATVIPTILGKGIAAFHGVQRHHRLSLVSTRPIGAGLVQLIYKT